MGFVRGLFYLDRETRKSEFEKEGWERLKAHRASAVSFPLHILIWGPSNNETKEYKARCKIREELIKRGHNASFSEDLCKHPKAIQDPLRDEFLQAVSADVIIMIYGSRGTQTERDTILVYHDIAQKAYVLIEETMWSNIQSSIASSSWEKMGGIAHIIRYKAPEELEKKIDEICEQIDKLRTKLYVDALMGKMKRYA